MGRHGRIRALTLQHLNQLTTEDLRHLEKFADRRLGCLPRSRFSAEDAVQKALLAILVGTTGTGSGRRPNAQHVQTKAAFLHYVRSAINSVIEALGRNRELQHSHDSIHGNEDAEARRAIVLTSASEADADGGMVDLKSELFARLRTIASRELLPVIDEWEKTFFCASQVPCRRKRDHVRQVRVLAMRILKELAENLRR